MFQLLSWLRELRFRKNPRPGSRRPALRQLALEVLEDRTVPTGVLVQYSQTQNWGSGFQGQINIVNQQSTAIGPWTLAFDWSANITSIWNAQITSHVSNHYVITGDSWDTSIAAGASLSFGFNGTPGTGSANPLNYSLNGVPVGGNQPPPPPLPTLSIANTSVTEGQSGTANAVVTVSLSAPSTAPVTVSWNTSNGTGVAGTDYQAGSGTLTFSPGQTTGSFSVVTDANSKAPASDTFQVTLSNASGATISQGQATVTIINPPPPSSGNFQYQVQSTWSGGLTAQITATNSGTTPLNNWSLAFDYGGQISSIWNASITSHTGTHYVVTNAGWNSTIPAGGSVSFGFVTSTPGAPATPINYNLSGASPVNSGGGGGGGGGSSTLTAVNDAGWTTPGLAVTVPVLANDTGPAGATLTVLSITQPAHGSAVLGSNGSVVYTPQATFLGSDSFTYTVSDGLGDKATATVTVTVARASTWPQHFSAPYVDATLWPTYNFVAVAQNDGIKFFTLAFIVADPTNLPSWGGYQQYDVNGGTFDQQMKSNIAAVRAVGGDVMVSFGGASGTELAQAITNVTTLTNAYATVVNAYQLTHIDFDIEGAAEADHASIDRRSQAIAALQQQEAAAGQSLQVWFTLPVLPTGLTSDGLYVLQSALKYGVQIGGVNIMAMDYGDGAAPNPSGQMGTYAIQSATSLFNQLRGLYGSTPTDSQLWQMVGVTPMIGMNDLTDEVFTPQDAQQLVAFAQQKGIGRLSFWDLNRDQQSPSGALNYVDLQSSSLIQQPLEFALIFQAITK
jgi:hypothetical protein